MIDIFTDGRIVRDEDRSLEFIVRADSLDENLSQARFHAVYGSVEDPQRRAKGAFSYLRFRRTASHSALAFQPVAAILTEFLQREVVKKECRGAASAPVAIFDRFCLGLGRRTGRIFHSCRLLYLPRK